jgi:hypothetical protein
MRARNVATGDRCVQLTILVISTKRQPPVFYRSPARTASQNCIKHATCLEIHLHIRCDQTCSLMLFLILFSFFFSHFWGISHREDARRLSWVAKVDVDWCRFATNLEKKWVGGSCFRNESNRLSGFVFVASNLVSKSPFLKIKIKTNKTIKYTRSIQGKKT